MLPKFDIYFLDLILVMKLFTFRLPVGTRFEFRISSLERLERPILHLFPLRACTLLNVIDKGEGSIAIFYCFLQFEYASKFKIYFLVATLLSELFTCITNVNRFSLPLHNLHSLVLNPIH